MNNQRRKELRAAYDLISQAWELIGAMQTEEEEAFDNMPDSLQESEGGQAIQEKAEELDSIASDLEDINERLEEVMQ